MRFVYLQNIKRKLTDIALGMIESIEEEEEEEYEKFWKKYSLDIKLGVIEDSYNRSRLAKLLRFQSSSVEGLTSLSDYVSRMKENQQDMYFIAGNCRKDLAKSPFVERLLKKDYEVLYLLKAVDQYCLSSIPDFDGKNFQSVIQESFVLPEDEDSQRQWTDKLEPLLCWFSKTPFEDEVSRLKRKVFFGRLFPYFDRK